MMALYENLRNIHSNVCTKFHDSPSSVGDTLNHNNQPDGGIIA